MRDNEGYYQSVAAQVEGHESHVFTQIEKVPFFFFFFLSECLAAFHSIY
jgi:hypothetical protein